MTDIVTRLRDRSYAHKARDPLAEEAADEIERLRSRVSELESHRCLWGNDPSGPTYTEEIPARD